MTLKPCATCGEPSEQSRCDEHRREQRRHEPQTISGRQRGYDAAWDRLSKRARAAQGFCSDCGTTEQLTADHSPEAWERKERGLPIRLQDITVCCRACNNKRGPARGPNARRTDRGGRGYPQGPPGPDAKARTPSHTPGGIPDDREEAV